MKYFVQSIIMILISIIFLTGCNIDINDNAETIDGAWGSRGNYYNGCYAHYTFTSVNDSDSGVFKIIKSEVLYGAAITEAHGTYTVDYGLKTISFVYLEGGIEIVKFELKDEKLFLEGDALHNLWNASRIELIRL